MYVLGINGSHRKGKVTYLLMNHIFEKLRSEGCSVNLIELADYNIEYCIACNKCLGRTECSIKDDDLYIITDEMLKADCIIIGSPVYFSNVTSRLKTFIDRTRWLHMKKDLLRNKRGACIVVGGLLYGGQEIVCQIIENYMLNMSLKVLKPRLLNSPLYLTSLAATLYKDMIDEKLVYKKKEELLDPLFIKSSELLVKNILEDGKNM
jgi:multimeric flavodoxin WrbA